MVMGRPREYDREDIKRQLWDWGQLETSINLCEFCYKCEPPISYGRIWDMAKQDVDFRETLEIVKALVAVRREDAINAKTLDPRSYVMNARTYDRPMYHQYKDEMGDAAEIKRSEVATVSEALDAQFSATMRQIKDAQETSKANLMKDNIDTKS